jgi:hypothetical protein
VPVLTGERALYGLLGHPQGITDNTAGTQATDSQTSASLQKLCQNISVSVFVLGLALFLSLTQESSGTLNFVFALVIQKNKYFRNIGTVTR